MKQEQRHDEKRRVRLIVASRDDRQGGEDEAKKSAADIAHEDLCWRKVCKQEAQSTRQDRVTGDVDEEAALDKRDQHEEQRCDDGAARSKSVNAVHEVESVGEPEYPDEGDEVAENVQLYVAHRGQGEFVEYDATGERGYHDYDMADELESRATIGDIVVQRDCRDNDGQGDKAEHEYVSHDGGIAVQIDHDHADQERHDDAYATRLRRR